MVGDMRWRIKLIEQSGIPLNLIFIPKFPLFDGCPREEACCLCENTGIKCNRKGVIYKATCEWCKKGIVSKDSYSISNSLLLQDGKEGQSQDGGDDTKLKQFTSEATDQEKNNIHHEMIDCQTTVAMDGMNKNIDKGGKWDIRSVAVSGMNKTTSWGGGRCERC